MTNGNGASTPKVGPIVPAERRISVAHPDLSGNELKYVTECIETEWISSQGRFVTEFEDAFREWTGARFALACSSGTTALHLALAGLGIGPGDEVIVPSMTYVASGNAVAYVGARPVLVDSDPISLNVTPHTVASAVTDRTRAVIPVDLFGMPADVAGLRAVLPDDVYVVEDAAEALGARTDGVHVGVAADVATFSFFGNKTLTTGEGGMVICSDRDLADRMLLLRGQGQDPQRTYYHPVMGFNYRLTNMQAAVGLAQLERVESHLAARRRVVARYESQLDPVKAGLHTPPVPEGSEHGNWMFTVTLRDGDSATRDEIRRLMAVDGIETRPGFTPLHRLPMYASSDPYPVADWISDCGICLPTHARLSDGDVDVVVGSLVSALSETGIRTG